MLKRYGRLKTRALPTKLKWMRLSVRENKESRMACLVLYTANENKHTFEAFLKASSIDKLSDAGQGRSVADFVSPGCTVEIQASEITHLFAFYPSNLVKILSNSNRNFAENPL